MADEEERKAEKLAAAKKRVSWPDHNRLHNVSISEPCTGAIRILIRFAFSSSSV